MIWVKSSYCGEAGACVEVADSEGCDLIHVRDSQDPSGPVLDFSRGTWSAFIDGIRSGDFER